MEPFILSCLRCEFEGMEGRGLAPSRGRMRVKQMEEVWQDDDDSVNVCFFFFSGLYQMSIPESAPVGSVVGRIWAKDRDIGVNAEMRYSIIDGDGRDTFDISTDPTNLFGIITVKKVWRQTDNCFCLWGAVHQKMKMQSLFAHLIYLLSL